MRSSGFSLLVAALLGAAAPAAAKDILDYPWIQVRTPHFVIASAQGAEKTHELAAELENFRTLAELLTNIGRFEERIPTKMYLLPKIERELGFGGFLAGYFQSGMRANYAAIIPSGGNSGEVLKHEDVHFLIHNSRRCSPGPTPKVSRRFRSCSTRSTTRRPPRAARLPPKREGARRPKPQTERARVRVLRTPRPPAP